MVDVLVDVARALDVLHQVRAVRLERAPDALQERERARLVVHRVERRHVGEGLGLCVDVERAEVALLEADVVEPALGRLLRRVRDRVRRQVVALEAALREAFREHEERPPAAAAEVEE